MKFIIGFSNPHNVRFPIYAWLIKKVFKTQFSHVYIRFYVAKYDRWLVYESVGKGSRFIEYSNWQQHALPFEEFEVPVTDDQKNQIIVSFIDDLGTKYGILQAIGLGIKQLAKRWFKIKMSNPLPEEDKEICSEAVTSRMLLILGGFKEEKEEVVPLDIYMYLKGLNKQI
jgi:hypothetical protein